jgi:hypothetical protein
VTNEEILRRMETERELRTLIRRRQLRFVGHVVRQQKLENVCLTGRVEGRRSRGRPRQKYMNGLVRAVGGNATPGTLLQRMMEREDWRSIVANVQEDTALR